MVVININGKNKGLVEVLKEKGLNMYENGLIKRIYEENENDGFVSYWIDGDRVYVEIIYGGGVCFSNIDLEMIGWFMKYLDDVNYIINKDGNIYYRKGINVDYVRSVEIVIKEGGNCGIFEDICNKVKELGSNRVLIRFKSEEEYVNFMEKYGLNRLKIDLVNGEYFDEEGCSFKVYGGEF